MTVTGALNSSNQFTSKMMTSEYSGNWGDGDGHGGTTIVQFPSQFTLSQWDTGTWKDGGDSSLSQTYTHRVYGAAELLNADKVATIAIGDGAAFIIGSGTYAGGTYSYSEEAGWDADTTLPDPLSEFMDDVDAAQVPAVGGDVTITFTGDAAFDCNKAADVTVTVSGSNGDAACEDLSLGWDWVNCWDIIENQ